MHRQFPLILVFILGVAMALQEFIPLDLAKHFKEFALDWTIVIGVFAMGLGLWSLTKVSMERIQRRAENWQYSIITLAGMLAMMAFSFWGWAQGGIENALNGYMFVQFFDYVMVPIQSTMFALLAFFIASAAYRAFRARSVLASLLLVAALIVMLRVVYMGPLSEPVADVAGWIINVPNLAAKRAIVVGVGLGIVATALKVVLGIERTYLGRD
jgi:cytochrome bd-type quinol oxidase subunit 2